MKELNHLPSVLHQACLKALSVTWLLVGGVSYSPLAHADNGRPVVPANLEPPAGQKVAFHAYAVGVQVYVCRNISSTETPQFAWVFVGPEAVLYRKDPAERANVPVAGIHYGGPTWEYVDESKVIGQVLQRSASPLVDTVPWLLLAAIGHEGEGKFADVTFIQRVNTVGGAAPATGADAASEGEEIRVPYTAEYYLYHPAD